MNHLFGFSFRNSTRIGSRQHEGQKPPFEGRGSEPSFSNLFASPINAQPAEAKAICDQAEVATLVEAEFWRPLVVSLAGGYFYFLRVCYPPPLSGGI